MRALYAQCGGRQAVDGGMHRALRAVHAHAPVHRGQQRDGQRIGIPVQPTHVALYQQPALVERLLVRGRRERESALGLACARNLHARAVRGKARHVGAHLEALRDVLMVPEPDMQPARLARRERGLAVLMAQLHVHIVQLVRAQRQAVGLYRALIGYRIDRLVGLLRVVRLHQLARGDGALRQLGYRARRVEAGHGSADDDVVAQRLRPVAVEVLRAVEYAQERAQRGHGAVGIVAAVYRREHLRGEALLVQPAHQRKGDVDRRIGEVVARKAVDYRLPGLHPGRARVVALQQQLHRAPHGAVGGQVAQRLVDETELVGLNKRHALQHREEYLAIHALAARMVHAGVVVGIVRGQVGHARTYHRPYLRAYGRAHAVGEEVVEAARQRRAQPAAHVGERVAVLVPLEMHVIQPFATEQIHVGPAAVLLHAVQVDQLQVQIVVFDRAHELLRIALYVHQLHAALQRAAQSSANVLAHPAGIHPVKKLMPVLYRVHANTPLSQAAAALKPLRRAAATRAAIAMPILYHPLLLFSTAICAQGGKSHPAPARPA